MLALDLLLQVHVLGVKPVLERLHLGERLPQPLVGPEALDLRPRPRREGPQHRHHRARLAQRPVVEHRQVAGDLMGGIPHRDPDEALRPDVDQVAIPRKQPLEVRMVDDRLSFDGEPARRRRHVVLDVLREVVALPVREHPDASGPIRHALGEEGVAHVQGGGEVAHQRVEEVAAGDRCGALRDRPEHLLGPGERLVGLHVLDGEGHLLGRFLEEFESLPGEPVRDRGRDRQCADGAAPHEEGHDHVGADPVGEGPLVRRIRPLGFQVRTEQRPLLLEHPAHVALARPHLEPHREVAAGER